MTLRRGGPSCWSRRAEASRAGLRTPPRADHHGGAADPADRRWPRPPPGSWPPSWSATTQPFFAPISAVDHARPDRRRAPRAARSSWPSAWRSASRSPTCSWPRSAPAPGRSAWSSGSRCSAATLVGGGPLLASQAGASAVLVATLQPPEAASTSTRASTPWWAAASALAGRLAAPAGRPACGWCATGIGPVLDRSPPRSTRIADALERPRRAARPSAALAAVGRGSTRARPTSRTRSPRRATPPASRSAAARRSIGSTRYVGGRRRAAGWPSRTCARWRAARCGRSRPEDAHAARGDRRRSASSPTRRARARRPARGRATRTRRARRRCARRGSRTPCWRRPRTSRRVHIVGQVRLVAVDLLRAAGMQRAEAQEAVRSAPRRSGSASPRPSRKPGSPLELGARPSAPSAACRRSPSSSTASA